MIRFCTCKRRFVFVFFFPTRTECRSRKHASLASHHVEEHLWERWVFGERWFPLWLPFKNVAHVRFLSSEHPSEHTDSIECKRRLQVFSCHGPGYSVTRISMSHTLCCGESINGAELPGCVLEQQSEVVFGSSMGKLKGSRVFLSRRVPGMTIIGTHVTFLLSFSEVVFELF